MEDIIRKRIEQFDVVFAKNPVPFMLYHLKRDEAGAYKGYEISYANNASMELLNTSLEKVIGKSVSSVSSEKLEFLISANTPGVKAHDIRYDSYCDKYLDLTAYQEYEDYVAFVLLDISEQIRQQQIAKLERDNYSHLLDTVPGGIVVFDLVRGTSVKFNYFNDEICKLTGYTREEILERGPSKVCEAIDEDLPYATERCKKAVLAKEPVDTEFRTRTKGGEIRYLRARLLIEETKDNELLAYAAYTDITMQKKAEEAIEAEMKNLSDASGNGLVGRCRANVSRDIIDNYSGAGRILIADEGTAYSEAVRKISALCINEEMGNSFSDKMLPDKLRESWERNIHELELEYVRTLTDGSKHWVRTVVRLYSDPGEGDIMGFLYTYDINNEKLMQMIVDHVTDTDYDMMGLISISEDQLKCVRASAMEKELESGVDVKYSIGMQEYVSRFVPEVYQEEMLASMRMPSILSALEKKSTYSITFPINFNGKKGYKKWDYSYLDDSRETIIFTRSDITELINEQSVQRENLRNALIQAEQASHAKTDFLSHMSHEIRTPMNAIIGMSTLAAQCIHDPKQAAECISKVGISARFLLSLINDILDMSRIESGKVTLKQEKFPFEELISGINSIIYNQAKAKGVDYECVVTSFTNPNYIGDEMKLQQIMINLLGNAVKFTAPGGKTQFIIHQDKTENGKAYFSFTVNDTGAGISEEFQKRMFEPFERQDSGTTSSYQGTGLGLAITKNLVDMMGGTINVNSIEGVGSEFTVRLTLDICEDDSSTNFHGNIHFEKLYTLIVDDDVMICEHTQEILREMGMRAEWVSSGAQAVNIVEKKHYARKDFDIVLLDWKMPDMDGIETARQIRKIVGPDVTIIVITAYDWSAIEKEAKAAGVNLLVTKPLFKSTLTSAFQKVFNERTPKEEEKPAFYDFSGRHILLVEDHILNIEVAKRLLESRNAQVYVAENGLKAIEMFTLADNDYYDAILMDIRMPVMDGLTAARSIRQLSKPCAVTVPIIAMSANAFDEDIEKSQAAGMNAHLSKPIEPELLFATLSRFFMGRN